ncbi:histidine kinase N-terminal 7TM domain-containing protein [Natronobeatus ordinarius]|uniref:histidine kinase N-terminal 7TM domain-containing protein n=1 Tax=Natronobeatus ordinarius TaxID=2963433 RepID=UPI0020CE96F4|nr:histidine kinase N-terminal 7TM domain-containing protein [Natronobeatus ordinarius]
MIKAAGSRGSVETPLLAHGWGWEFTPFTPVLIATALVTAAIGFYAWRNRDATGATAFVVVMASVSLWSFAYGLHLAGTTEPTMRFWSNVVHVGVATLPVAWLCFTLQFAGHDHLVTRWTVAGLSLVPAVYLGFVWTNQYHHLVREPHGVELVESGSLHVYVHSLGPVFDAHALYGHLLLFSGVVVLVHLLFWSSAVYRRQVGLLILAAFTVGLANTVNLVGRNPIPNVDPTPFSFPIAGALILVSIYHYRLFDLTPVARAFVVDNIQEGVLFLDTSDRVVDLNESAERLLEVDRDDVVGRPFESVLPFDLEPTDRTRHEADSGRSRGAWSGDRDPDVATGRPMTNGGEPMVATDEHPHPLVRADAGADVVTDAEVVVDSGDGPRFLHFRSTPVADVSGDPLGRSIVVRDVTETRELQADLEATLERLRRSNAELESFAGVVSHDLREPLRTTVNYLSMAERRLEGTVDDDDAELLAVARENAQRGQAMVDDLLRYSRVGPADDEFEPVDCNRVVADVLDALRYEVEDRDATIEVDELPTVVGVEHLLCRLFQNLLANALEHSGDEPPTIDVTATRRDGAWAFAVSDDGVGIEPDRLEYVFELFTHANRTTDDGGIGDGDGTGMGLAICEKIVEEHGGQIAIDSTPGEGTTVGFTIPAASTVGRVSPVGADSTGE